ncbi:MAG: hypothetical protein U0326_40955 [Polyangiales bacterium]
MVLLAWVPDFNDRGWVWKTLEHRCRDVSFDRYAGVSVTCNGDQVEVLHTTTTSAIDWSVQAQVAWRSVYLDRGGVASVVVSINDDIVMIENEQCPTCNVQRGPVWVFRPSRTRPAVLREIQGMIRLPTAVARTTVAAWRQR